AGQLGSHIGKAIKAALRKAVVDRHILAVDIPGFGQSSMKERSSGRFRLRPTQIEIANHGLLLRTRQERPSDRRATKPRDEFSPPHVRHRLRTSDRKFTY